MGLIAHPRPTCGVCGVLYVPEYQGPCQEPYCSGRVSWEATALRLTEQLQGAVEALERIAHHEREGDYAGQVNAMRAIAAQAVYDVRRPGGRYETSSS